MVVINLNDLTINSIYDQFDYVKSIIGNIENYHCRTKISTKIHDEIEIYFEAKSKQIKPFQIDTFNKYISSFNTNRIENLFSKIFTEREVELNRNGKISQTFFEIIQVPFENLNFDLVLVCSKEYKRFLFPKKQISLRIEFKNGMIKSAERKVDTTIENEK